MPGDFERPERRINTCIEKRDFWLVLVRQCKRLTGSGGLPNHLAPCSLLQNGQHSLAKDGLLHDDHHLEWLCDHALCAGTTTTRAVLPRLLPACLCQECPRGERACAVVCLGTPGMCSLVNTGVYICLVGEVFRQYVLVWEYCITKRGRVLRFLAVLHGMRTELAAKK